MLALVSVSPVLEQLREDWLARDPLIPEAHEPIWRKRLRFIVKGGTAGLLISTASWLGSLPLIAAYFHMLTPGSLFANLVVVPLSDFCLGCCAASLLITSWFPALGELLNHSAWFWMECMVRASQWFARCPGAFSYVAPITLTQAAGFYGALLGLVLWFRRPEWRGRTIRRVCWKQPTG